MISIFLATIFSIIGGIYFYNKQIKEGDLSIKIFIIILIIITGISISEYDWWFLLLCPIMCFLGLFTVHSICNYFESQEYMKPILAYGIPFIIVAFVSANVANSSYNNKIQKELANYSTYSVDISYELVNYNGVGREFVYYGYVNNQNLADSKIIYSNGTQYAICYFKVIEKDKYPDVSEKTQTIDLSETDTCVMYLTVYENGGYDNAGSYATFKITFLFKGHSK